MSTTTMTEAGLDPRSTSKRIFGRGWEALKKIPDNAKAVKDKYFKVAGYAKELHSHMTMWHKDYISELKNPLFASVAQMLTAFINGLARIEHEPPEPAYTADDVATERLNLEKERIAAENPELAKKIEARGHVDMKLKDKKGKATQLAKPATAADYLREMGGVSGASAEYMRD